MAIDPGVRTRHAVFSTRHGGETLDIGAGSATTQELAAARVCLRAGDRAISAQARVCMLPWSVFCLYLCPVGTILGPCCVGILHCPH